jgi:membrane associated rhomboid family serine protease
MQEGGGRPPLSCTQILIIALVGIFALQCVNDVYFRTGVDFYLGLTPAWLTKGWVWQLFTFQVMHVGVLHILCNLLSLWFFGPFVESVVGARRFLLFFFGCGLVGGLLQGILMVLFPNHFAAFVFGASAGTSAMFAIFARLEPGCVVRVFCILPVRALTLLWALMAISLFFTLVPSGRGGSVAHAAHLGGMLAGLAVVRLGWHQDFRTLPWENLGERIRGWFRPRPGHSVQKARPLVKVSSVSSQGWVEDQREIEELPQGDFISKEVDPILDKISAHGIQSLTERERKILDKARSKMGRRG